MTRCTQVHLGCWRWRGAAVALAGMVLLLGACGRRASAPPPAPAVTTVLPAPAAAVVPPVPGHMPHPRVCQVVSDAVIVQTFGQAVQDVSVIRGSQGPSRNAHGSYYYREYESCSFRMVAGSTPDPACPDARVDLVNIRVSTYRTETEAAEDARNEAYYLGLTDRVIPELGDVVYAVREAGDVGVRVQQGRSAVMLGLSHSFCPPPGLADTVLRLALDLLAQQP